MAFWNRKKKEETAPVETEAGGGSKNRKVAIYTVLAGILVLIFFTLTIMLINYSFPDFYDIKANVDLAGHTSTRSLIIMTENMTKKWLPNDKFYPTIFLDNPQNFQLGLLESVRYTTRVFRDKVTRLRTTDKIDTSMEQAFVFFSNDPFKWILPSAESKFNAGVKSLKVFESQLKTGQSSFYQRADNLNELLDQYVSLLGGVNTRLSNAPRRKTKTISQETAGDAYTKGEKYVDTRVPWTKLDDNFYFARGVAYGTRQMMLAIKVDFDNIFKIKNAGVLVDRIIELLDQSQFEPIIVLNGSRGSIFANHSLQLQSLLEDARQKMRSLQDMIRE